MVAGFSVLNINEILNGDKPLFEIVPVSKRFIVYNVYLSVVLFAIIMYVPIWFLGIPFNQTISTLQGNIFILMVMVIILFIATTISFLSKGKHRVISYIVFFLIGYGLLIFLKGFMPVLPETGRVEFLESLSIMPRINEILLGMGIATAIIVPLSIYAGYKLYLLRGK